jgi:hypothetical protein
MTVWTNGTIKSTHWTPEITTKLWDGTGSWDGVELSTSDPDLLYDGHVGTAPFSTTYTKPSINSTTWS